MLGLIAKKVGMTQVFDAEGNLVPVTVIKVDANVVIAQRTIEKDGYAAVVIGVDDMKKSRVTKPYSGQFPENIAPKKRLREFRNFERECAVGDNLGVDLLDGCRFVDVVGVSKGKGFQGVIKRWGFSGGRASHGSKFHREPGSTGQCTSPGRSFKNIKMPGRMGRERVTVLNLKVVKIDVENRTIMVRGAVPGTNKGTVVVRAAVKK
ncbi:MAG: 50S ribosomal protein L3 [Treponema sp. GWB1_62_6]|nr:MAG: 50S ribosomal protein L3 [Treponema sp. GWC1_61_84]OHE71312.1 MAG: 50S ribosomal protein L3 [Treponema sp. GWB1_62_6]HCM25036.1 50S ribosomal protein L3 [Treponema sp.]